MEKGGPQKGILRSPPFLYPKGLQGPALLAPAFQGPPCLSPRSGGVQKDTRAWEVGNLNMEVNMGVRRGDLRLGQKELVRLYCRCGPCLHCMWPSTWFHLQYPI